MPISIELARFRFHIPTVLYVCKQCETVKNIKQRAILSNIYCNEIKWHKVSLRSGL